MKLSKEFIAMFREEAKKAQWEINRWNGKSIDDLVVDYLERKELKPEDFTGAVVLTVDEAKNIYHDFASMYVIAKGTYPKDGMRKPFTLDILKMEIEKAEKQDAKE